MRGTVTSAVYPLIYMVSIHIVSANKHPPTQRGVIISQKKTSFLGVFFYGDHDFEGLRSPKAHLGTVNAIGNLQLDGGSIL